MSDCNTAAESVTLDPADPLKWAEYPFEALFSLTRDEVEGVQLDALIRRFESLRPGVAALDKLATRQGVERVATVADAIPAFFDNNVLKSYPLSLIEKRQFSRLTSWLDRLTTHDLSSIPLDGLNSVDAWIDRLDDHGMLLCHSSGTSGKLSFLPRSKVEAPAWKSMQLKTELASTGLDFSDASIPMIALAHRAGHSTHTVISQLMYADRDPAADRFLYDFTLSSDFLSLAARLQQAEQRGELDQLEIDPKLLEERRQLIETSRSTEEDRVRWFARQADELRGKRVRIGGTAAELVRMAVDASRAGVVCEFAPGSIITWGGGLKGYRNAPPDWENMIQDFYGIHRVSKQYGMSECISQSPCCSAGYFHFFPTAIPIMLDENSVILPTEGVQTGRLALFDLLAATYWGGFISGDRVTMYWDYDCPCGWKGPRIDGNIARFSELQGGDDKLTCAGTAQAYNDFMNYVSEA